MLATVTVFGSACGGDDSSDGSSEPTTAAQPTGTAEATDGSAGELDVSGFDPCTALTAAELTGFRLATQPAHQDSGDEGAVCGWSQGDKKVLVMLAYGAPEQVGRELPGEPSPTTYAGRSAFKLDIPEGCALLFEAPGNQTLGVLGADPGKDHCAFTEQATDLVLARLD